MAISLPNEALRGMAMMSDAEFERYAGQIGFTLKPADGLSSAESFGNFRIRVIDSLENMGGNYAKN